MLISKGSQISNVNQKPYQKLSEGTNIVWQCCETILKPKQQYHSLQILFLKLNSIVWHKVEALIT